MVCRGNLSVVSCLYTIGEGTRERKGGRKGEREREREKEKARQREGERAREKERILGCRSNLSVVSCLYTIGEPERGNDREGGRNGKRASEIDIERKKERERERERILYVASSPGLALGRCGYIDDALS